MPLLPADLIQPEPANNFAHKSCQHQILTVPFERVDNALYASDGLSGLFCKLGLLNRRILFY